MKRTTIIKCLSVVTVVSIIGVICTFSSSIEDGFAISKHAFAYNESTVNDKESRIDTNRENSDFTAVKESTMDSKADIYHMVLNSVDYYNCASGVIKTNFLNGHEATIEYTVDMCENRAYQHVYLDSENFDEETYVENGRILIIDNKDSNNDNVMYETAYSKRREPMDYEDDERRITNEDGIPTYYYRMNPTNLHFASTVSIFPQEMAFGFLSNTDLWDINEKSVYLGRECVRVSGITESEYGKKLNIGSFEMLLDCKSGIILKFEGRDYNGNLVSYVDTIKFSDVASKIPSQGE